MGKDKKDKTQARPLPPPLRATPGPSGIPAARPRIGVRGL